MALTPTSIGAEASVSVVGRGIISRSRVLTLFPLVLFRDLLAINNVST
jgi:hypothetical protein